MLLGRWRHGRANRRRGRDGRRIVVKGLVGTIAIIVTIIIGGIEDMGRVLAKEGIGKSGRLLENRDPTETGHYQGKGPTDLREGPDRRDGHDHLEDTVNTVDDGLHTCHYCALSIYLSIATLCWRSTCRPRKLERLFFSVKWHSGRVAWHGWRSIPAELAVRLSALLSVRQSSQHRPGFFHVGRIKSSAATLHKTTFHGSERMWSLKKCS